MICSLKKLHERDSRAVPPTPPKNRECTFPDPVSLCHVCCGTPSPYFGLWVLPLCNNSDAGPPMGFFFVLFGPQTPTHLQCVSIIIAQQTTKLGDQLIQHAYRHRKAIYQDFRVTVAEKIFSFMCSQTNAQRNSFCHKWTSF